MSMKLIPYLLAALLLPGVHTAKAQTQPLPQRLGIYNLPPFERAIACTKFYEGWHGKEKHLPYVGYGHRLLPGESFTPDMSRAQGDSLLRADMRKLCRMFRRFGRDSTLLACLAYQVGPYRLLGNGQMPKSRLIRKLERGDRNIQKEYLRYCHWNGKKIASIQRRRRVELQLLFAPDALGCEKPERGKRLVRLPPSVPCHLWMKYSMAE